MTKKEKVTIILDLLREHYGPTKCYLNHENPWQLLIATILSAQCTDDRVNLVTKDLFQKYTSIQAFAEANQESWNRISIPLAFIITRQKISLPAARNF